MGRFLTWPLLGAAALAGLYFGAVAVLPLPLLFGALDGAFFGVAVAVTVIYAPVFWRAAVLPTDRAALLALGVGLSWAAFLATKLLATLYRINNETELTEANKVIGFFILLGVVGGALHIIAPGCEKGLTNAKFGGRYRAWVLFSSLVGASFGVIAANSFY